jgi:hypothetical protein
VFDLGLTGPDQGEGATYIVVGPEADPEQHRQDGAHVYQSASNNISIGLRILDPDPGYFDKFTSAYRMGRVGEELAPSNFIQGRDVEWSATAPRGLDYWEKLSGIVNPGGPPARGEGCDFYTFRDGLVVRKDSYWKMVA